MTERMNFELSTAEYGDLSVAYRWWRTHGDPELFYDCLAEAVADRATAAAAAVRTDLEAVVAAPVEATPCAKVADSDPWVSWKNGYEAAMENISHALATTEDVAR